MSIIKLTPEDGRVQKVIDTVTEYESLGTSISLTIRANDVNVTYCSSGDYQSELPNIHKTKLINSSEELNHLECLEGELIFLIKSYKTQCFAYINRMGELIIIDPDAIKYYIDDNGNLIYDYCREYRPALLQENMGDLQQEIPAKILL